MGDSEACNGVRAEPAEPLSGEAQLPVAADAAGDGAQRRRLPGAVGSEDGGDLSLLDAERDAVQRLYRSVPGCDAFELEEGRHYEASSSSPPRYASITEGSR